MLRKQAGVSFPVLVGLIALLVFVVVTGVKVVPVYLEYFSIKRALEATAKENPNGTASAIRDSFNRKAQVEYFTAVHSDDIYIDKDDNGNPVLTLKYEQKVALVGNVSFLFDFNISTQSGQETKE